jgi:hypothetical protein
MRDYAMHLELVEQAEAGDKRKNTNACEIVQKAIALAALRDADAGAEYLRQNEIPLRIAHRVLVLNQRRAGDWS